MKKSDGISIITCTHLPFYMDNIFANYARQTYPIKELIIILNNRSLNISDWYRKADSFHNVRIVQIMLSAKPIMITLLILIMMIITVRNI